MEKSDIYKEIEKSQNHAIELRNQGYGCAQCVLMALSDKLGLQEKQAAKMGAAYGTGFAGSGGICGVISILGIAEGLLSKGYGPEDKSKVMWNTKAMLDRFSKENGDRSLCCDLKGKEDTRKCPELIKQGIEIFLESHPELAHHHSGILSEIKNAFKN
ncbi:MAG: C-GCAxxG-C-C family protein [Muribaculaceae bacterium]|nr:C-GCAxxG-C-C family protein [Muribaculaceae bacterium]